MPRLVWNDHLAHAKDSRVVGDHGIVKATFDYLPLKGAESMRTAPAAGEVAEAG